jgi:hypothetical protein
MTEAVSFLQQPNIPYLVLYPLPEKYPSKARPRINHTEVRIGWTPDALWVYAAMEDVDIHNSATQFNGDTWATGDVFEVFMRNNISTRYWELHVTPENQNLQLCWPNKDSIYRMARNKTGLDPFYVWEPVFESWTQVEADKNQWFALAKLPAGLLSQGKEIAVGDIWHFSFCRYDCTRGIPDATLYSTSRHPINDFHRQRDWNLLEFV